MKNNILDNLVPLVIIFAGLGSLVLSQSHYSSGNSGHFQQSKAVEECGIQDINEDFDLHVAAPWAAALFRIGGDIFKGNINFEYLSTAVLVSKDIAITSSTFKLNEEHPAKLQVLYGHRGSAQQKIIRIRKVELMVTPPQPLQLKIDTSYPSRTATKQTSSSTSDKVPGKNDPGVYMLHLETPIEVTAFSKPVCVSRNAFRYMNQYFSASGNTKHKHLSGYASRNDSGQSQHGVSFSPDSDWRVQHWDSNRITVVPTLRRTTYDMLPHNFNPGSALTVKINRQFFLVGILLKTTGSETYFRSMENLVDLINSQKQDIAIEAIPQKIQSDFTQSNVHSSNSQREEVLSSNIHSGQDAYLMEAEQTEFKDSSSLSSGSTGSGSINSGPGSGMMGQMAHRSTTSSPIIAEIISPPTATRAVESFSQSATCSQTYTAGVDIECVSRPKGVSTEDCIKRAPANTIIRLSCKNHYVPVYTDRVIEKKCDSSGQWLPRVSFDCKLDCGTIKQTIPYVVHGLATASEQWPWHTAVFKLVNETTYAYICGATLISRNVVVTAAHCVQDGGTRRVNTGLFKVIVGAVSSDLDVNRRDSQTQEFGIREIIVNEHYSQRNYEGDIAIMQLDRSVRLTDYVRPVCWPTPGNMNKALTNLQLSEGNTGVVVGFGTTHETWSISKTLRMATLPYVSVKQCTAVLERIPHSTQYCAGYTNGTAVCEGDSGGSQVFKDGNTQRYYIQGIISHGNRRDFSHGRSQCDNEKYTVFTKVEAFSDWIQQVIYKIDSDYTR